MALDAASVITRSASDLCLVTMVMDDVGVGTDVRMEAILQIAREWDRATAGSGGRTSRLKEAAKRRWGFIYWGRS